MRPWPPLAKPLASFTRSPHLSPLTLLTLVLFLATHGGSRAPGKHGTVYTSYPRLSLSSSGFLHIISNNTGQQMPRIDPPGPLLSGERKPRRTQANSAPPVDELDTAAKLILAMAQKSLGFPSCSSWSDYRRKTALLRRFKHHRAYHWMRQVLTEGHRILVIGVRSRTPRVSRHSPHGLGGCRPQGPREPWSYREECSPKAATLISYYRDLSSTLSSKLL